MKRILAFRVIALLMLTALVTIPIIPASAGEWDWFPYTKHYTCVGDSKRELSICTYPTDTEVLNRTVYYAGDQYYDIVFGAPVGNLVPITVPNASYHSEPFFLKRLGVGGPCLWMQVRLVKDGNGTLGIANGALSNVNMNVTVTGDSGKNNFTESIVRWGGPAPAGSIILSMPLNNTVWIGTSETDPTLKTKVLEMNFPMITTTGTINVKIVDTTPYPGGSISMNGYKKSLTGARMDPYGNTATLAGGGAGLDIYAYVAGLPDLYTDYIFVDNEILSFPVGGTLTPVDKLALLTPYIALVSTIILAVAAVAIYKYRKKQ